MLLALDINSERTGLAFGGVQDSAPRSNVWHLPGCDHEDTMNRSLGQLYMSISELSKLIHADVIVMEAPFDSQGGGNQSAQSVAASFSLAAVARAAALNAGARVVLGHVQTWRKHFVGHGRPANPKRVTMERCAELGWNVKNHDEGDACGLWSWGMSVYFPKWRPGLGTPLFSGDQP